MSLQPLAPLPVAEPSKKLEATYQLFRKLTEAISKRKLPADTTDIINGSITRVNTYTGPVKGLRKLIRSEHESVITLLEKNHNLVPMNYYRNKWMALGMAIYGIPMGIVFGTTLGSMAFIGIGIPIGMVVGMSIGTSKDKKAAEEGRQLEVEAREQ